MEWELTEVPRNLTPSLQDSAVDVVAAKIEPKLANTLIGQLSKACPLENLRFPSVLLHQKRNTKISANFGQLLTILPHDPDIVRGFREEELPSIFNYMMTAIQLSKYQVGNAALIVDPSSTQIIAKATDQTHQHHISEKENKFPGEQMMPAL